MRKFHGFLLGIVAVAGLIAGCGGSGAGTSTSFKKYELIMNRVFKSASNSVAMGSFPQPSRGARNGSTSDLVKQRISDLIRKPGLMTRDSEPPPDGGGGTGGNGDGGWGVGTVYFDDWSRLWVRIDEMETDNVNAMVSSYLKFKSSFWEDQALTKPAGSAESTQTVEGGKTIFRYKHVLTAGPMKGMLNESTWSVDEATGSSEMTYKYIDPVEKYEFEGTGLFNGETGDYSFTNSMKNPDGTTVNSTGNWKNGKGSFTMQDSRGYRIAYHINEDYSGSFKLEGPESVLPAIGSWNAEGKGQVRFADGTVEDIEFFWQSGFVF